MTTMRQRKRRKPTRYQYSKWSSARFSFEAFKHCMAMARNALSAFYEG